MPEIGTSGLMSGDGKRGDGQRPQATAPILDSTNSDIPLETQTPPKRGLDASKRGIVVELDAPHARLDEGTLLHHMNSEALL